MGTSLDSRDDRNAYVGYVFQSLNAFVVNLAPNAGIGDIAERGPIDISNEPLAAAIVLQRQGTIVIMEACKLFSRRRVATTACAVLPAPGIVG